MITKMIKYFAFFTLFLSGYVEASSVTILTPNDSIREKSVVFKNEKAIDSTLINDGPYIFINDDNLLEKSIVNGEVKTKKLTIGTMPTHFDPELSVYKNVKKIVALSDIHGQYDLAITILKNNKIINKNLNWSFGKGHLVIVGDVFDRGDKVTETLWFIYKLEKQAKKCGGKVHFLLGNHEYMVMHNDLRYIHEKYELTSKLFDTSYGALFGKQTLLGRWLRSKATIIKINDNVFVHGGISQKFIAEGFDFEKTNQVMSESLDRDKKEMKSGPFYKKYYGSSGPIWYRGYFQDDLPDSEIRSILTQIKANHIVVGHCSQDHVLHLYDKKVFAVDSSIKNGKYGEVLFIKKGHYARGTMKGKKIKFD